MARGKKEEPRRDTNAWMTTYTDLMILLLTFFVLLLSLSVVTEKKKLLALNSLTGAFGFKPGGHSILGTPRGLNITIGSSPMKQEDIDFEGMRNIALKNALEAHAKIVKEDERTIITLGNRVLFEHRSSRVKAESAPFLLELGEILKDGPHTIELRGYAATSETAFDQDPFKTSMLLSSERASEIYRFFAERGGIPAKKMVAHGFGTNRVDMEGGKSPDGLDRQVELILDYRDSIPYRLKRTGRESLLDFKGFLFRFPGDAHE